MDRKSPNLENNADVDGSLLLVNCGQFSVDYQFIIDGQVFMGPNLYGTCVLMVHNY